MRKHLQEAFMLAFDRSHGSCTRTLKTLMDALVDVLIDNVDMCEETLRKELKKAL